MTSNTDTQEATNRGPRAGTPRLERPEQGRILAGVSAGIGNRYGLSPWLPRLGFLILAFFGGLGILLYLAGWLLIPKEGELRSQAAEWIAGLEGTESWVGAGLIVLGGLIVIGWLGFTQSELVWAAALVVLGILLYRGDIKLPGRRGPDEPPPPETGAGSETGPVSDSEEPEEGGEPPPPSLRAPAQPPSRPGRAPKPRSILGRLTIAALLITIGVMTLADSANLIYPTARHYLAAALLVVGVGLFVGAWLGRSRGLIVLGILLVPIAFATAVADVAFEGRFGDPVYRPVSIDDVRDPYRLAAGSLTVDLTRIEPGDEPLVVETSVGAGEVVVLVPDRAEVTAHGRVGIGEVTLLGTSVAGIGRELTVQRAGETPLVAIDADVGFGSITVRQVNR